MNGEKGMTMVELIAAVAVTGVIVVFLSTAIYQIVTVSEYGNNRLNASHELQNAAFWFNKDAQGAVDAVGGGGLLLTTPDDSTIGYSLVGTELRRVSGVDELVLARNVSSADFTVSDRLVTMYLESSPPGRDYVSENCTYQAYLRPSEAE